MDTVYPVDHPFQSARWINGDTLNAPGAADMKGGLSLMLEALLAVEAAGADFGYEVVVNSDEETGSFSAALLAEAARGKVAALTDEPRCRTGRSRARAGNGQFLDRRDGPLRPRRAQSGGGAQRDRRRRRPRAAAERGEGRGAGGQSGADRRRRAEQRGARPCRAARQLPARRRRRAIARAKAALDEAVAAVAAAHEVRVHVHGSLNRPPKPIDAGAARLFALVKDAGADLGEPIAWRATGGVCDGQTSPPAACPWSTRARGGAIHSADEFLIVPPSPSAPRSRRSPCCASAREPSYELRRSRRHDGGPAAPVRDGEADRRRLHQPAARPQGADREARA
ncbi:M20/M25/M40 family metallo-hydrolase [Sphingomonas sp. MMS24-JH45]